MTRDQVLSKFAGTLLSLINAAHTQIEIYATHLRENPIAAVTNYRSVLDAAAQLEVYEILLTSLQSGGVEFGELLEHARDEVFTRAGADVYRSLGSGEVRATLLRTWAEAYKLLERTQSRIQLATDES